MKLHQDRAESPTAKCDVTLALVHQNDVTNLWLTSIANCFRRFHNVYHFCNSTTLPQSANVTSQFDRGTPLRDYENVNDLLLTPTAILVYIFLFFIFIFYFLFYRLCLK